MFEKITGVKCPPLDFYIVVAILIHIAIFYMFFKSKMEGFNVEMIDYCDSNPTDPECVELNQILDYCIEFPDDPDCVDFEIDLFSSMENAGMNVEMNNANMNNTNMNNANMNNMYMNNMNMNNMGMNNSSGLTSGLPIKILITTLIFTFAYLTTYGIFLKLFCKNKMVKSAWFLLLAPIISMISSYLVMGEIPSGL